MFEFAVSPIGCL